MEVLGIVSKKGAVLAGDWTVTVKDTEAEPLTPSETVTVNGWMPAVVVVHEIAPVDEFIEAVAGPVSEYSSVSPASGSVAVAVVVNVSPAVRVASSIVFIEGAVLAGDWTVTVKDTESEPPEPSETVTVN